MRKGLNEPTFGEKVAPVLEELETAMWEHEAQFEGERPMYPDTAIRSAAKIFTDVLIDRMFAKQEKDGVPFNQRCNEVAEAGELIRQTIIKYTGLDTHVLMKEWLKHD